MFKGGNKIIHISKSSVKKSFIFGYFGWYNAGDDAIGIAILKELSKKYPNAEFTITAHDNYFVKKNDLNTVNTIEFKLISILRAIKNSDLFIISGGTHFQDQDEFKFRRLKLNLLFALIVIYAKFFKKEPILLGHGVGPFFSRWSLFFVKLILNYSRLIIVRDEDSFNIVNSLGFGFKCFKGFDMAAGLFKPDYYVKENNCRILGISLLPFYSIYSKHPNYDKILINELSECIKKLLIEDEELQIKLFAFRTGKMHSDNQILDEISKKLDSSTRIIKVTYMGILSEFITELCECNAIIGMRYHSLLFSYFLKKPIIAIEYMGKCKSLAKEIKLPNEAIVTLSDVKMPLIYEKARKMLSNPNNFKGKLPIENAIKGAKYSYNQF